MADKRRLYVVPKTLDAPVRILGLTRDELIPAALMGGGFFLSGRFLLAMLLSAITVIAVKVMKRGQGSSWLVNVCYWYFPAVLMQPVLRYTPASRQREYIA